MRQFIKAPKSKGSLRASLARLNSSLTIKRRKKPRPKVWVCIYDLHYPAYDKPTFLAILDFLKHNKVDGLLFGGDFLDLEQISRHTKGKPGLRRKGGLKEDLDGFYKEVLTPLLKLVPKKARKVAIWGNHERFLETDLIEDQPELAGLISIEKHLRLKELGFKCIEQGGAYHIASLACVHGDTVGSSGTVARKALEIFGESVLLGHVHQLQSATKTSPISKTRKICSWVSPIVGSVSPTYARKRANSWVNGFTIVEARPNGTFNCNPIVITEGEFSYGGKTYSA